MITQRTLAGAETLAILPLVFLLRLGLGAVSYAAMTPGGLFAPLLVLGAQLGLFFGLLSRLAFPDLDIQPEGFAVVGMAAFFTGVVRAPLTGIVLVTEMTANVTMLLPMLGACFAAMLIPTLLSDPPIYNSLRENTLQRAHALPGKTESAVPNLADSWTQQVEPVSTRTGRIDPINPPTLPPPPPPPQRPRDQRSPSSLFDSIDISSPGRFWTVIRAKLEGASAGRMSETRKDRCDPGRRRRRLQPARRRRTRSARWRGCGRCAAI